MNDSNRPSHDLLAGLGIVGLLGVALIHLLDLADTMAETPYLGWLYVGLIGASVLLAGALLAARSARVWAAVGVLDAAVLAAFVLSRTTGLPAMTDDIGNWGESLGLTSLFVEGGLLALSVYATASLRHAATARGRARLAPGQRADAPARRLAGAAG